MLGYGGTPKGYGGTPKGYGGTPKGTKGRILYSPNDSCASKHIDVSVGKVPLLIHVSVGDRPRVVTRPADDAEPRVAGQELPQRGAAIGGSY